MSGNKQTPRGKKARYLWLLLSLAFAASGIAAAIYAQRIVTRLEAFDLIVVKYEPSSTKLRWDQDRSVEELDGPSKKTVESNVPPLGLLTVLRELQEGKQGYDTPRVIIVLSHMVSGESRFSLPSRGIAVITQGTGESWTTRGSAKESFSHFSISRSLENATDVRIEVEVLGGGIVGTEVSVE